MPTGPVLSNHVRGRFVCHVRDEHLWAGASHRLVSEFLQLQRIEVAYWRYYRELQWMPGRVGRMRVTTYQFASTTVPVSITLIRSLMLDDDVNRSPLTN